jgi:hypothetical protein
VRVKLGARDPAWLPHLWIVALILVILAVAGGVVVNRFVWLLLVVALIVAVLQHDRCSGDRFRDRSNPDDRLRLDLAHPGDLDVLTALNERGGTRHHAVFNRRLEQVLK